jgi:hypothetical protein
VGVTGGAGRLLRMLTAIWLAVAVPYVLLAAWRLQIAVTVVGEQDWDSALDGGDGYALFGHAVEIAFVGITAAILLWCGPLVEHLASVRRYRRSPGDLWRDAPDSARAGSPASAARSAGTFFSLSLLALVGVVVSVIAAGPEPVGSARELVAVQAGYLVLAGLRVAVVVSAARFLPHLIAYRGWHQAGTPRPS